MTITLFGHKDTPETVKPLLKSAISSLITDHNADIFYVGNNGSFDMMSADTLFQLSSQYPHIRFFISLSEINIGKQKIYSFKDNYAFSSSERDKWIEVCYGVAVIQVRQT